LTAVTVRADGAGGTTVEGTKAPPAGPPTEETTRSRLRAAHQEAKKRLLELQSALAGRADSEQQLEVIDRKLAEVEAEERRVR
jgi:hypothetical protein